MYRLTYHSELRQKPKTNVKYSKEEKKMIEDGKNIANILLEMAERDVYVYLKQKEATV